MYGEVEIELLEQMELVVENDLGGPLLIALTHKTIWDFIHILIFTKGFVQGYIISILPNPPGEEMWKYELLGIE